MPYFPSMRPDAGVADIYRARPHIYRHWMRMGEEVMTKDSPLSQGERELIATYVSALNACDYCQATHLPSMKLHGLDGDVLDALLRGIDTAPVAPKLRPLFHFARKLTLAPVSLGQADADAVYAAGWDEEALHTVIAVTCRFVFMNRLVMAHGLAPPDAEWAMENAERRLKLGYSDMHGLNSDAGQDAAE